MLARALSDDAAKRRLTEAVTAAERHTSAEIVVAVRRQAAAHTRTSLVAGAACAGVVLLLLLALPQVYDVRFFPVELGLAFVLGAYVVSQVPSLRRALTPEARIREAFDAEAERLFDELGVERTRGRTGVLVLLGLFERRAAVVADVGLDGAKLTATASPSVAKLQQATYDRDLGGVVAALEALGVELGRDNPRREDDENELGDEVHT